MEQKKSPCGSEASMSLADKIKFVELVDKNASPVGYKKSLGMNVEDVKKHLGQVDEYREHIAKFRSLMDLMKAKKLAATQAERKELQSKIRELQEELNSYGKEKTSENPTEQSS